jgi:hypothetical protein
MPEDGILYCGGFAFYLKPTKTGNNSGPPITLERVRVSAHVSFAPPIQIISTGMSPDLSRGGHNINFFTLPPNEFALSILSGGVAYDIAYASSRQDFAYNLREKGSFYPLNDVPGVQEFLDGCFPYIRDAATDKNGDIWMLPVSVNVGAIIYHDENSKKAGLDFANAATVNDIVRNIEKGIEYDPTELNYRFLTTELLRESIFKYLRNSKTLNTPEFRQMAETLKGLIGKGTHLGAMFPIMLEDRVTPNDNFLFDNYLLQTGENVSGRNDLNVASVTGTDGLSPADCVFLVVNPDSKNLENTLAYISSMCDTLMNKENGLMLVDGIYTGSEYIKQLYSIYENSVIDFNISDEAFADVFDRYLRDEITLDQFITEADRKLRMYLNE